MAATCKMMGIVNLTDNSFVVNSRSLGREQISVREKFMQGADIVDIGACSTAPGNVPVTAELEMKRLSAALPGIFEEFGDRVFSIDTFRTTVAEKCLSIAARYLRNPQNQLIVNDVSSGADDDMLSFVADNNLQYIAMDSDSNPYLFFEGFAQKAARIGVARWILDPGFGFGKSIERNWEILEELPRLKDFGKEILVAMSRKRMIYVPAGLTSQTCANESMAAEDRAVSLGATILRTHDIRTVSCI